MCQFKKKWKCLKWFIINTYFGIIKKRIIIVNYCEFQQHLTTLIYKEKNIVCFSISLINCTFVGYSCRNIFLFKRKKRLNHSFSYFWRRKTLENARIVRSYFPMIILGRVFIIDFWSYENSFWHMVNCTFFFAFTY